MNSSGWHANINDNRHRHQIFVWIGNITPLVSASRSSDYSEQQKSVHGQLLECLSGKFDISRVVPADWVVILRYILLFARLRQLSVIS